MNNYKYIVFKKKYKKIKKELKFMKKIFEHQNSAIYNLKIKKINNKKIWIDKIKILSNPELLLKLDKDEEVIEWINDLNLSYKDDDW